MKLSAVMDSLDGLDEAYKVLYTEREGKYELTGIEGVKTQNDVTRVQNALTKEREVTKELTTKLSVWDGMDHEEIQTQLDKIPVLEAASKGKLDQAEIDDLVSKQVEGQLKSKIGPLDRKIVNLTNELADRDQKLNVYVTKENNRLMADALTEAAKKSDMHDSAVPDLILLGQSVLTINETGEILVKEGTSFNEGSTVSDLVDHIKFNKLRSHWWPENVGGGARPGGGAAIPDNPWGKDNWNRTKQAMYIKEHGHDKAALAAKAAGVSVNAIAPAK